MWKTLGIAGTVLFCIAAAGGQEFQIANPSFEQGGQRPTGWSLRGDGSVLSENGSRAIAVTGTGAPDSSSAWQSEPLPFRPLGVYRLGFRMRRVAGSTGLAISGPGFCNRDISSPPEEWTVFESFFMAPSRLSAQDASLRFGQWEFKGTVAFDDITLHPAIPLYAQQGDLVLGEGEMLLGHEYRFTAPFSSASANHARPLHSFTARFNTNRWVFAAEDTVIYQHAVGNRRQRGARVGVGVSYHTAGELVIECSSDQQQWQTLGTLAKVSAGEFEIPDGAAFVRLRARGGGSNQANLQVASYNYSSVLDGEEASLAGWTRFLVVTSADPALAVRIDDIGQGLPGGSNVLRGVVVAQRGGTAELVVDVAGQASRHVLELKAGSNTIELPYHVAGTGTIPLRVRLGGFRAETSLNVAELHNASYGASLPEQSPKSALWWCSSGWKVSRQRPAPAAHSDAVLVRAARNEAEAVQLVLRPRVDIRGLTVRISSLAGPDNAVIGPENIDILRVRYVQITRPTDATGIVGPWPDPLPPMDGPIDLRADENQPLWIRVRVPRGAKPGVYGGRILLSGVQYTDEADLKVEVYDFELPDRMTCVTAFGFSHWNVLRYQKLEEAGHRRTVLEKYLASFAAHHISPYDPAPLDAIKVTWDKATLTPRFDFSAWDAAMTRAIERYRFNSFQLHIPGMGGGTFHSRVEGELLGYKDGTPEYRTAFENYCKAIESHLREKGWLDRAYVYWFDEPDPKDYAFVNAGFRKLKEAAPGLNRMLTEQVEPELAGGPNIWCPVSYEYNHQAAEERRRHGEKFWWYVCTAPKAPYATLFIDHPATELRVWLWQTWQRKIDGILVWDTNYWTSPTAYPKKELPQNPYEDPMSWQTGYGAAPGSRNPWGNGDGRFIYPPEAAANGLPAGPVLDGPVESIRWEMLRDGIEDYEYCAILRRLLVEKGDRLPPSRRESLAKLLEVPDSITSTMTVFTKDPAPIEAHRHSLAKAIESLR